MQEVRLDAFDKEKNFLKERSTSSCRPALGGRHREGPGGRLPDGGDPRHLVQARAVDEERRALGDCGRARGPGKIESKGRGENKAERGVQVNEID